MFRKKCKTCGEKISRNFEFCPHCGTPVKQAQDKEDYGMLGKDDHIAPEDAMPASLGFGSGMLDKMLKSAMNMLEKEMRDMEKAKTGSMKRVKINPKTNFQLYVNGKKVDLPGDMAISQQSGPKVRKVKKVREKTRLPMPSEGTIKKSAKLPRKEAKSNLKRLSNKIVYEIEAPGIKSMDKVLINKLEDGVEVRIFTKEKVLTKNISLALPLIAYYLKKQKLFLEFQTK